MFSGSWQWQDFQMTSTSLENAVSCWDWSATQSLHWQKVPVVRRRLAEWGFSSKAKSWLWPNVSRSFCFFPHKHVITISASPMSLIGIQPTSISRSCSILLLVLFLEYFALARLESIPCVENRSLTDIARGQIVSVHLLAHNISLTSTHSSMSNNSNKESSSDSEVFVNMQYLARKRMFRVVDVKLTSSDVLGGATITTSKDICGEKLVGNNWCIWFSVEPGVAGSLSQDQPSLAPASGCSTIIQTLSVNTAKAFCCGAPRHRTQWLLVPSPSRIVATFLCICFPANRFLAWMRRMYGVQPDIFLPHVVSRAQKRTRIIPPCRGDAILYRTEPTRCDSHRSLRHPLGHRLCLCITSFLCQVLDQAQSWPRRL